MSDRRRQLTASIVLPHGVRDPLWAVVKRFFYAVLLIAVVALIVRVDHEGYRDSKDGTISTLDAFYYATVSVTTTGYGDIVPVSNVARLMSTSIVTIARVVFLILLVGTTFEVATKYGRDALQQRRWRRRLNDHVIICGFGTKGQSAAKTLLAEGIRPAKIVVIDDERGRVDEATALGLAGIVGDATRISILRLADAAQAQSVIVAPNTDAAAALITLTARELNKDATIVSAVREDQNAHLLRQGGADSVIVSSDASGRLLAISTYAPEIVEVLEELLIPGAGLDLTKRHATADEFGGPAKSQPHELVMAVLREGNLLLASTPEAQKLVYGDQIFMVTATTHKLIRS